jgi:membrane-bound lytic murein transglycosylase B
MRTCAIFLAAVSMDAGTIQARTVFRCVLDGTVSLATQPDPGARCQARELDDNAALVPNLWGSMGVFTGALYKREVEGKAVYSTRDVPGSTRVLSFTVNTPPNSYAHEGRGKVGAPRLRAYAAHFKAAAKRTGVDAAWLRAIAHAESYFDATAVSSKGALGVMQLMPEVAREYGVEDPFDPAQSIGGAARHLKFLEGLYKGDLTLVAAAYNAGIGAVTQYDGVPPYAETQAYVAKVHALHARYREAMGLSIPAISERPALPAGSSDHPP